jgi:hypothetical protein
VWTSYSPCPCPCEDIFYKGVKFLNLNTNVAFFDLAFAVATISVALSLVAGLFVSVVSGSRDAAPQTS